MRRGKRDPERLRLLTIALGVSLTVAVVNLYATFSLHRKVDALRGKIVVLQQPKVEPSPTTEPSKSSGLQVSVDDDPGKGSEDAPVTIVEFSEYQCPFCARFFRETLPVIEKNYIRAGKVRLVYRDFPLRGHQYAQKAAEAAECADEQGKFWDYHDRLFENQNALDTASLKQYARDLGLNAAEFNECLDSSKMASEVQGDVRDGEAYGVSGTPTFFINGTKVVGAQAYAVFQQVIERELKK